MTTLSQRSFSGGEIAPPLYARADTQKYQNGLRTCRNNLVMRHGGTSSRPGTYFIGETKYRDKTVRMVPFEFSDTDTYVLEFGDQYMRVIKDASYLYEAAKNISGITQANPGVLTVTAHGYSVGDEVYVSGIVGMTELNGRSLKVATVPTADTLTLDYMDDSDVDTTGFTAYSSGGTLQKVYEVETHIEEASLAEMQFVQSADVMFIASQDFPPTELARVSELSWTIGYISFEPGIDAPAAGTATQSGTTGSTSYNFKVTAVDEDTNEESLPSTAMNVSNGNANISETNFVTVTWSTVTGAREYNVYLEVNGVYGYIGIANGTSFKYIGNDADVTDSPPSARNPFDYSTDGSGDPVNDGDFPAAVTLFQQRLCFANTVNKPETVWMSKIGAYKNFTTSIPLQDDDAVTFSMVGKKINAVRHLIDLDRLVTLTQNTEFTVEGGASGIIIPAEINPKAHTYNGSSRVSPIVSGGNALYLQSRGSIVRDLGFDYSVDGYRGSDLTIFSSHLFDGYEITNWAYQQTPHSIIWTVRDDGTLLGLTYLREHQMLAWHRHDFEDGFVEDVCVIPEGDEDSLYLVVKRTVSGNTYRSLERMVSRNISNIVDYIQMDAALSYDGRTDSRNVTISGGTDWTYTEDLTLTVDSALFDSGDVGNFIHVSGTDSAGNTVKLRLEITGYTSSTVVTARSNRTVPSTMRNTSLPNAYLAVDTLTGLWHLEGKDVAVVGDGFVVANPNNAAYETITVSDGSITLDKSYVTIHVGVPITCDLETLDIESLNGETLIDDSKVINRVHLHVEESRGIWVGAKPPSDDTVNNLEGLTEKKPREDESMDDPPSLITDKIPISILSQWNSNGRVFIRQVDPVPMSILAIAPEGKIPLQGGQ